VKALHHSEYEAGIRVLYAMEEEDSGGVERITASVDDVNQTVFMNSALGAWIVRKEDVEFVADQIVRVAGIMRRAAQ